MGVEVTAAAGPPVQRFTARADGDGANTVFDLTDALAVTFEGDILVSDETPTGAVDGGNRRFTPLQTMGDSGIAHDNLPDGYWAREDIVVRIDGATLPLAQYAILPDYPTGTVMVQIQTRPSPPPAGADIRFTYKTPIFDIHDPGATPISALVSATDGVNTFAAQSIDAALGVVTLDGPPGEAPLAEGARNVVLTFQTGELGRIVGVAVSTETARSTGETRRYSVIESPAGSGRYPFNVGLVTAADLRAVRDRITAPDRTVGELLADLYVAGEGGLAARLTELRDELGLADADAARTLVDRLLPAADGDTLFVGYGSAGASATIDLAPPTLQALSPAEGSFVTSAMAELRATATDTGAGVDLSGLGTAESAALMTVDGVVLGGAGGGLGAIAESGGAVTFTASIPASDRVVSWSMDVGDRVGNRISEESAGAAGAPFTFIVDRTPPVMTSASTGLFYDAALRSEVGPEVGAVRIEFDGGVVAGLDGSAAGRTVGPGHRERGGFLSEWRGAFGGGGPRTVCLSAHGRHSNRRHAVGGDRGAGRRYGRQRDADGRIDQGVGRHGAVSDACRRGRRPANQPSGTSGGAGVGTARRGATVLSRERLDRRRALARRRRRLVGRSRRPHGRCGRGRRRGEGRRGQRDAADGRGRVVAGGRITNCLLGEPTACRQRAWGATPDRR